MKKNKGLYILITTFALAASGTISAKLLFEDGLVWQSNFMAAITAISLGVIFYDIVTRRD